MKTVCMYDNPIKLKGMVCSLCCPDDIEIVGKLGDNQYLAKYKTTMCTAIFNPFTCMYYADDVYGVINEEEFDEA